MTCSLELPMEAVILDVGGVLVVPHHESVGPALEPWNVRLDAERAERAHYHGVRALDSEDDEEDARRAYLVGYAEALGIAYADRDAAIKRIIDAWSRPTVDVWRQRVRGSMDGLRRLESLSVKLGIISNADGTIEEQLKRSEICQV